MEDFGYSKEQQENYVSSLVKKTFLIAASLFSIACFGYITMSAYYFFSQNRGEIKTIEPSANPIKIIASNKKSQDSIKIDNSIYEDIFGTRKKKKQKIKLRKSSNKAPAPKKVKLEKINLVAKKPEKIIVYSDKKTEPKKRQIRVQIAALTSKKTAYRYFKTLRSKHSKLFSGLQDYVEKVDLGKRGIFYRIQIGNFYDQIRAEKFCKKYVAKLSKTRADCIIVE